MAKKAALYLRVSTVEQTTENQRRELEAVASRSDWEIVEVYEDNGVSGAKRRDQRPAYDRLLKDATRRQFDVVMSWSVDRLGRSLQDLVAFMEELNGLGVDLYLHQEGIDTTTPSGRAMFQMTGVFAEFERAMIRERVRAGIARAKAQGKKLGRPTATNKSTRDAIREARSAGTSFRKIARQFDVSVGAVQRAVAK